MRFFILTFFLATSALTTESESYARSGHFGVRLGAGGAAYVGGIDDTANRTAADENGVPIPVTNRKLPDYTQYISAGWLVPLQLEATYGLTNAFEILLGIQSNFSGTFLKDDQYIMRSFGVALGYRYYFDDKDPIQAYLSSQIALDLTAFTRLESRTAFGFLFNFTPMFGVFIEAHLNAVGVYSSEVVTGKGAQLGLGSALGVHLHF